MRLSGRNKRVLIGALVVAGAAGVPALVWATCGVLAGTDVPAGELRFGIASNNGFFGYANAYNGGSTDELNLGANHEIGWLPPGWFYNVVFGAGVGDQSTQFCLKGTLRARTSAWNGTSCNGTKQGGDWIAELVVNTCGMPGDSLHRIHKDLTFFDFGFSPSIKTGVEVVDGVGNIVENGSDYGCYALSPQAGGCTR
jgi:hypothetical protein